jgi:hypothetical protein
MGVGEVGVEALCNGRTPVSGNPKVGKYLAPKAPGSPG